MPTSRGQELPLIVQKGAGASLPAQIVEQIRPLIETGVLKAGDLLPSSRDLARQLGVSRGTVVFAYEQLIGEGYLQSGHGGTRVDVHLRHRRLSPHNSGQRNSVLDPESGKNASVATAVTAGMPATAPGQSAVTPEEHPVPLRHGVISLLPGAPDTTLLATTEWRAAWRRAAANPADGYPAAGSTQLRTHITEHLRLTRSVLRSPDDVLVTAGAREGFRLLLTLLRRRVRNRPLRIAVENPGYPSLHRIPQAFGHTVIPIPVDEQGLDPQYLPTGAQLPDIVLVAPSHQYPLGASMPAARRLELLEWARTHQVLIVEDDYDSELRYTGDPLPALAAMDRPAHHTHPAGGGDRVITLGSFAKVLTPGLNLGFLVMPRHLRDDLLHLRADLGNPVPALVQDAAADLLAAGGVRRHIARMRKVYRARRALVVEQLGDLPGADILPMDGGLHAVLQLHSTADGEADLVERAEGAGVLVAPLGSYWSAPAGVEVSEVSESKGDELTTAPLPLKGVVIGFGGMNDRKLAEGLQRLRRVL